jgi:hypothetical protein
VFSGFPAINAKTKIGMLVALSKVKLKRPTLSDVRNVHFSWRVWTDALDNSGDPACTLVGWSANARGRWFDPSLAGRGSNRSGYQLVDR